MQLLRNWPLPLDVSAPSRAARLRFVEAFPTGLRQEGFTERQSGAIQYRRTDGSPRTATE
jgi:hypothetical protein